LRHLLLPFPPSSNRSDLRGNQRRTGVDSMAMCPEEGDKCIYVHCSFPSQQIPCRTQDPEPGTGSFIPYRQPLALSGIPRAQQPPAPRKHELPLQRSASGCLPKPSLRPASRSACVRPSAIKRCGNHAFYRCDPRGLFPASATRLGEGLDTMQRRAAAPSR
jgi:hypothetical protein